MSQSKPYSVIVVAIIISCVMGFGLIQLEITVETEAFLPDDYTSVRVNRIIQGQIGEIQQEIILVEGEDILDRETFHAIYKFKKSIIGKFEGENYILRMHSYQDPIILYLESFLDKETETDNWKDIPDALFNLIIESALKDETLIKSMEPILKNTEYGLILITINPDLSRREILSNTEELRDLTKRFSEDEEISLGITGQTSMELDTNEFMERDNRILIPLAAVLVILILFFIFRRITDTILPFLILGLGALWMIGTMGLMGIPFTMVYVALVPIMLGIGIDYNIHMLNRYYEERGKGNIASNSTVISVRTVGVAIAITAVTTAIGFGSFGVSEIPPIREFGLVAGIGIIYIFLLTTLLLPSIVSIRDRGGENKSEIRRGDDKVGRILDKFESFTQRKRTPILVIASIITIICVFTTFGLTTSMNFDQFLSEDIESVQIMNRIEDKFGGQQTIMVLAEGSGVTTPDGMEDMLKLEKIIMDDPERENLITHIQSPASYLLMSLGIEKIPEDPEQLNIIIETLRVERSEEFKRFLPRDNMAILYFTINAKTSDELKNSTELIRDGVRKFSIDDENAFKVMLNGEPSVGGGPPILSDIMNSIIPDMRNSIILAVILVGIVLTVIFRSPLLGLIGIVPVVLALFWEFGILYSLGWPLDVMNMTVSALAIGIGIDFSIHITHRFREELIINDKTPEEAISISVRRVGRAIIAAASTTIGVFILLSFSGMPPIARFGQLSALIILFCLIASLTILPALLISYSKWRKL